MGAPIENVRRITMNMDGSLLDRIEATAKALGINRSAAIAMMCAQYLEQRRAIDGLINAAKIIDGANDMEPEEVERVRALLGEFAGVQK